MEPARGTSPRDVGRAAFLIVLLHEPACFDVEMAPKAQFFDDRKVGSVGWSTIIKSFQLDIIDL